MILLARKENIACIELIKFGVVILGDRGRPLSVSELRIIKKPITLIWINFSKHYRLQFFRIIVHFGTIEQGQSIGNDIETFTRMIVQGKDNELFMNCCDSF